MRFVGYNSVVHVSRRAMQRSRTQERRRLGASPNMIRAMETVVQPADIPMAIPHWVEGCVESHL